MSIGAVRCSNSYQHTLTFTQIHLCTNTPRAHTQCTYTSTYTNIRTHNAHTFARTHTHTHTGGASVLLGRRATAIRLWWRRAHRTVFSSSRSFSTSMRACICVCAFVHKRACGHMRPYAYPSTCLCVCTCVHMRVPVRAYTCVVRAYACMRV